MRSILVVDDDPKIVRLVRSYLEQAGFTVETASDGESALRVLRNQQPALMILDLMLPGVDGLTITQTVRADPALAATPILMLTARVEDIDRILGLEMGADDYVTKPFNPREVVARVKAILRRAQRSEGSSGQSKLRVGPLSLDPDSRTVRKRGQPVNLTPSEFEILWLLMRNPGRAFTRAELINEALGYEYAGLDRTVDSHIKNLRRKLEDDPRTPRLIETVFGVGYRLNDAPLQDGTGDDMGTAS
jgi:two-component system alkaline phosphatase synthesis response regulator PhoP